MKSPKKTHKNPKQHFRVIYFLQIWVGWILCRTIQKKTETSETLLIFLNSWFVRFAAHLQTIRDHRLHLSRPSIVAKAALEFLETKPKLSIK